MGNENDANLILKINDSNLSEEQKKYTPTLCGNTYFVAKNGIFVIDNVTFSGNPGVEYGILIFLPFRTIIYY